MDMWRLQLVRTVTTAMLLTLARHMATTVQDGSRAAHSSEPAPGSTAATTVAASIPAAITGTASMDGLDMATAAVMLAAQLGADSMAARHTVPSTAAEVEDSTVADADKAQRQS